MSETKFKLEHPFTFGSTHFEELTIEKMTVKHLRLIAKKENSDLKLLALVGHLTGLHDAEVDAMDTRDYERLMEILAPFLPNGLKIALGGLPDSLLAFIFNRAKSTDSQ
jgi:hypothetical protein